MLYYHAPKSNGFGHGPKVRGIKNAWREVQRFLLEHTAGSTPGGMNLMIYAPGQWTDESVVKSIRAETAELFGNVQEISAETYSWAIPSERTEEALALVFSEEKYPRQQLGPTFLSCSYRFDWISMPNAPIAPSEDKEHRPFSARRNSLGISIQNRRMCIQPGFVFAGSEKDRSFVLRLEALERQMPFRPNTRYYYRVEPTKTAVGEKIRRLQPDWKTLVLDEAIPSD